MSQLAHRYNVTFSVTREDGSIRNLGTWDSLSGGEASGEVTKHRPGGMAAELALGGFPATYGDLTISRYYDAAADATDIPFLMSRVNKGRVVVNKQPLDENGNTTGNALVYTGILASVTPPDVDSTSADVAMLEVGVTVEGAAQGANNS